MSKTIVEVPLITTQIDGTPDNFLICAGSPEERCLGSIEKLDNNYKTNYVFIWKYSHFCKKREEHLERMRFILHNKTMESIKEFSIDEESPIPIINEIVESIVKYVKKPDDLKITIDITTIIKWHILLLIRALDMKNLLNKCRFLYTEPKDYLTDIFQPLSFGLKQIFSVPSFSGNYDFSKDCLLVIMLGYEGDRAMALLENIDPTACLLLVPKPAYHPEWEGRTEEMNKEIINVVGASNIRYIDSRNPMLIAERLDHFLSGVYSKYNCLISPMGTKPQTLGLYLYWIKNKINTSLLYSSPLRHNDLFYSEGVGRTWVLPI